MMSKHEISVVIVDDHRMFRSGLRALLHAESGIVVVGEARDGREALDLVRALRPDVVVMDLQLPILNGIDTTRQAIAAEPGLKVVAVSANTDDRSATEMRRAGALAYVDKGSAFEELVTAIRSVVAGRTYYSPSILAPMIEDATGAPDGDRWDVDAPCGRLSPREREVVQLIAEGKSTKEVARCLGVSVKTAETHRRNLMEKLHLDSIAELTKYAIREGLTSV